MNNLVVEREKLIRNYLRDHDILETHKTNIDVLKKENINLLENTRFLESEHDSLLEKNNTLTQKINTISLLHL